MRGAAGGLRGSDGGLASQPASCVAGLGTESRVQCHTPAGKHQNTAVLGEKATVQPENSAFLPDSATDLVA